MRIAESTIGFDICDVVIEQGAHLIEQVQALSDVQRFAIAHELQIATHVDVSQYDLALIIASALQAALADSRPELYTDASRIKARHATRLQDFANLVSRLDKGELTMATKKGKRTSVKKEKKAACLAGIFKEATSVFANVGGKEAEARVHADGTISFKGRDFTSPSAAGRAACGNEVNGWTFWRVRSGETLAVLTGRPIKASTSKTEKPAKAKAEKKPKAVKPKRVRKASTEKAATSEMEEAAEVATQEDASGF